MAFNEFECPLIIALQGEFVVGSIVDIEIINQCFILFQIGFDQFVAFDNHFPGGMAPGDFFPQFGTAAGNIEIAEDKVHFGCVAFFLQIFNQFDMRIVYAAVFQPDIGLFFNRAAQRFITDNPSRHFPTIECPHRAQPVNVLPISGQAFHNLVKTDKKPFVPM